MAHMLFDALNGVQLDNHTVQTILETTTLSHDVSSGVKLIAGPPTTITLDEEDVFQCGKCKKQFTSFALFMCHKKEHSSGDLLNESPDNCQDLGPSESSNFQQLQVQALDSSITANELCQRIILSEADILSFSIDDDNALNLSSTQASASLPNIQNEDSFLAPNTETPIGKVLQDTSSVTISDNYSTNLNNQPVILTQETSQNAFTSSPLHNIHSISSTDKEITTDSSSKDMSHNINILATYPETHPKGCKVLLSNNEFIEGNVENGTLFLECDKIPDKILQYTSSSIEADGTVLLDYAEGNAKKTCKVLLTNGEYTETSIEYIDGTNSACEFPGISDGGNTEGGEEIIAVSLLDVIESPVALELSEAINDVNSEQMTVQEENISLAIPDTSSCSNTKTDKMCPENLPDGNNRSQGVKNAKLKCSYCNKMFAKNFDLNQHMRSHTGEKPFQCVVCGRAFSQKSNVKKHMATHKVWPAGLSRTLPKEPLQLMEKSTSVDEQMHGNSCDENGSVIVIDRSYVCQYCDSAFPSYYELKTHMKKHSHQKVYKCVQRNCQKTFEDLNVFLIHTRQHTNDVQYCCHVCFKKFNTLEELGVHQQTHDPNDRANVKPRYYLCVKCKSKFTSSKALDQHLSTTNHHFPCSHCGKVFACERYLRRHLPTHGAPASFVCSVCGKGFRTEQYLNIHRIIHSGDRPHTCMHCPAAFNRKDKLARHLLIHQSVKKFKCPFNNFLGCSKEFNRRDKLKLHILTHSAVKPFHCWKCNKMFHKQNHLRDHERTHHSADIPFSCSRCGLSFKKKINLSTHLCNDEGSPDKPESVSESQYRGDTLEVESSRPGRGRKLRKIRSKKALASTVGSIEKVTPSTEGTRLKDSHTMGLDSEDIADADSVPTIEIIVMPMHVNHRNGNEGNKNVYVMFPASSNDEEVPIKSLQSSLISTLNNSSKCVPEGHSDHTITNIEGMDDLVIGM